MSVEDEKKKPRRAPAKKTTAAASTEAAAEKKVKATAAKASPAKKKAVAKTTPQDAPEAAPREQIQQPSSQQNATQPDPAQHTILNATTHREPTHAEIAERAHAYFVERGYQHGFHDYDWYRAEKDLREKRSQHS